MKSCHFRVAGRNASLPYIHGSIQPSHRYVRPLVDGDPLFGPLISLLARQGSKSICAADCGSAKDSQLTPSFADSNVQPSASQTTRNLNEGDTNGTTTLENRLLVRFDLHCRRFDHADVDGSQYQFAIRGCARWSGHFLLEFSPRRRAVFLAHDCELVPYSKVLARVICL